MKKSLYWLLAIVITLVLSVYQRMTGPTYPQKVTVELNGKPYKLKLPRSGVQQDEVITIKGVDSRAKAQLHYRRYPTSEKAGWKDYPADEPLVIRFRNDVPASVLIPHILLMFGAMLFAVYTFLLVITGKTYKKWLWITVATLFVGGFILGPMVQHVAFGPWWAGFPYGTDLTDNKTLIAFVAFLAAVATLKWKYNKWVVALAVLLMIIVFSIPHSAYGSEYDYTTQQLK